MHGFYEVATFTDDQTIQSLIFPELVLTAEQALQAVLSRLG